MVVAPPFKPFEHPEQARFEKTRALFTYWRKLLAERGRPARTDLDPAEMKPFLPNVVTGHIEAAPFRGLYRLVGTKVAEYSRLDFSNRYLDELRGAPMSIGMHAIASFMLTACRSSVTAG